MTERETASWWQRPVSGWRLALSLASSAAVIFAFVGTLGWMVGAPLRWTAALVGAVCGLEAAGVAIVALLRRHLGVSGDVPAALTAESQREAERYSDLLARSSPS